MDSKIKLAGISGQAEMRKFLESTRNDSEKPESRLARPSFQDEFLSLATKNKLIPKANLDRYVKYDVSELA